MKERTERPNMRFERLLWAAFAVIGFITVDLLSYRIVQAGEQAQTWQFAIMGLAVLLMFYSLVMLWLAWTLEYGVKGSDFYCRQGVRRVRVRLNRNVKLVRWRERWGLGTDPEAELGVEQVRFFPSFWFGRPGSAWVLIHQGKSGRPVALVFRPSPELLEMIRSRVHTEETLAG